MKRDAKKGTKRPLPEFLPHNDNGCDICHNVKYNHSSSRTKNPVLHKELLDNSFTEHGFIIVKKDPRVFCKLNLQDQEEHQPYVSELTVHVNADNTWSIYVIGRKIIRENLSEDLPDVLTDENINSFVLNILSLKICKGNSKYVDVIQNRISVNQPFLSASGQPSVIVESMDNLATYNKENFGIGRHPDCPVLFNGENMICDLCSSLEKKFRVFRSRQFEDERKFERRTNEDSTANIRYLSREELVERLNKTQSAKREAIRKTVQLQSRIQALIDEKGVALEDEHSELIKEVSLS